MTAALDFTAEEITDLHGFTVHPVANLFPLILGVEFKALVQDICDNGLAEPVTVDINGLLIDGRNRVRACHEAGVAVATKRYVGDDVTKHVISLNLHRRQLTDSQRAMVAAKIASRPKGQYVRQEQIVDINNLLPITRDEAAELLSVGQSSITAAKTVIRDGSEDLAELVSNGVVAVNTAARVADLPAEEQAVFVAEVNAGAKPSEVAPPLKRKTKVVNPAPPEPTPAANPRNGRKHLQKLEAITVGISGYRVVLDEITELDQSVNEEEAARLAGDLNQTIRSLKRIKQMLDNRKATT